MKFKTSLTNVMLLAVAFIVAAYATLPTVQAQVNYGEKTLRFASITTTTRACASFPLADVAHVQLVADVTVANTSTVATQYSNNSVNFTTGETLSDTVATDTPAIAEGNLYTVTLQARDICLYITPVNTYPITVTAYLYAPNRE